MSKHERQLEAIRAFAEAYDYDMSYQERLLSDAPESFEAFARAQGLAVVQHFLTDEVHWTARISMMLAEDCGDCLVLTLRMAREAGFSDELAGAVLDRPAELPTLLQDVRSMAAAVSRNPLGDAEVGGRLLDQLGPRGFAELSVCLTGCRLYSSVKRALLAARPAAIALAEAAPR
jgi:hypothetical protein